jgi:hypothetical protein
LPRETSTGCSSGAASGKKNPRLAMPFLNPEARVAKTMSRPGYHTFDDGNLKDIE